MWSKFIIVFGLFVASEAGDIKELETAFLSPEEISLNPSRCNDIIGKLHGCNDCYLCDEPQVTRHAKVVNRITLVDDECQETEICCIPQENLVVRESGSCGVRNIEGYPPSYRPSPRSVLDGEYPWRAWIYSKRNMASALCAATYVHYNSRGLITSATCVDGKSPSELVVKFSNSSQIYYVEKLFPHEKFYPDRTDFKTDHYNDIAYLSLKKDKPLPDKTSPVCLPSEPPRFGTPCISISSDHNFVNMKIPKVKYCTADAGKSVHVSQLCAITHKTEHVPELGSALFCLEEHVPDPSYVMYGIALGSGGEGVTGYTNVTHFASWIELQVEKAQPHSSLYW